MGSDDRSSEGQGPEGQPGHQPSEDQTGLLGPEFVGQRANPMPPAPPPTMKIERLDPPPILDHAGEGPAPRQEDSWQAASSKGGRSRWAIIGGVVALVVVIVAGVVLFMPKGAEGEPIAYSFEEGQKLSYRMSANMDGTVSMGEIGSQDMSLEMGGIIHMEVVSVDAEGVATVETSLDDLYMRSTPPTDAGVPSSVTKQTLRIAPDGTILEGSLGFSELGATSQTPPGWDQYSPMLPDEPVSPGDTWSDETEIPFMGDETITISSETQLLDYVVEDGEQVAVVRSDTTVPLDIEISLADIASQMGLASSELGLPKGADPKISYEGTMEMQTTARIAPVSQELKGTVTEGTMIVDITVKDMPGVGSLGPIRMNLDLSVTMEAFQPKKAKPAEAS